MKKVFFFFVVMFAANLCRAQWEPDVRLTNDPGSSQTSMSSGGHAIATTGDTVHVVWYDDRDGNQEIYYKRSIDGGLTWGADIQLTNEPAGSKYPSIAVSGSVVHVTWCDQRDSDWEIYYKRSTDGGNSWGTDTRLSYYIGNSWHPSIAVSGEFVHLVWYEFYQGWWEIFYKRSTDSGLTWEADVRLTDDPGGSYWASICASGPVLHVAWYDGRDGNAEIYYKRSTDAGITWGPDTRLTFDNSYSGYPCIGVSASGVHVVWEESRDGNSEIYYKRSTDGGISWGADIRLTNNSGESYYNNLAVSGSAVVHVVWADTSDGNWEIYYKRSTDGGLNWEPDIRLTNDMAESNNPFISTSGSIVHVVWYDDRDGNNEIYYKRDPTGGFAVGIDNELTGNSGQQISFYPNPASSVITFKFKNDLELPVANKSEKAKVTIRNILGEELVNKQIENNKSVIDVSDLQNGLYFVGITTSGKQAGIRKLIIFK